MPELELSTSATTRPRRAGEVDGVDYHFLDPEEFDRRVAAGEFLEHATYSGNRTGRCAEVEERNACGAPVVLEIELQGARQVRASDARGGPDLHRSARPRRPAPPSGGPRHRRSGDDRVPPAVAEEELAARGEFPHTVVNDDIDRAAAELAALIRSEG